MTERSVFLAALDILDPPARAAYLDAACGADAALRGRVEGLLAAHLASGFMSRPAADRDPLTAAHEPSAPDPPARGPTAPLGTVVAGRYTLAEVVGEGGMGTVFRATQTDPVRREVALKLIKAGMDSRAVLARFEAERQALALMDHPNIARIYDGGVTEAGQPFFVMELVQGVPLATYCDAHRLTVDARLRLFVLVCRAVQHAHQKGIIHRDLKPGNVLVAEVDGRPTPKVIDFGVAKATGQKLTDQSFSDTGAIVGTPAYMSPEQADPSTADIDTRTDVYALGVILYELMAGSPPIDAKQFKRGAILEVLRMVREVEPPRPSAKLSTADARPNIATNRGTEPAKLAKLLRGELDWVVMKALEKDRARRYDSATAFARDVERYLADEVVEARPPSRGYRLRKFVARNRGQVLAAGLVLVALVAGITGTTLGLLEAREKTAYAQEQEAEAKRQEGHARAETAEKALALEARTAALNAKAEALAKETVARKDEQEANRELWAGLQALTGNIVGDTLGTQKAVSAEQKQFLGTVLPLYRALAAKAGNDEATRARVARAAYRVGLIEYRLGRRAEAAAAFESARDAYAKLAADFPAVPEYRQDLAADYNNLGLMLKDLGQWAEAEEQYRKGQAIIEKLAADFPAVPKYRHELAQSHNNLGVLLGQGRRAGAEEQFRKGLAVRAKLAADFPDSPDYRQSLATSHTNLGNLLAGLSKWVEAEEQFRKGLAVRGKLAAEFTDVPEYREDLAASHTNLGLLLKSLDKRIEAEEQYRKGLAIQEKLTVEFPAVPVYRQNLAQSHNNLGALLFGRGQRSEAEEQHLRSLALRAKLATDFPAVPAYREELAQSHYSLGVLYLDGKKLTEAIEQARFAIRADPKYPNAHALLGGLLQRTSDIPGARAALTEATRLDPQNPQWKALLANLPPLPVAPMPREKK